MKHLKISGLVSALILSSSLAHASSCESYPYSQGMNIETVKGGTKIVATASVAVSFDDISSINDAREEATMEAKAMISNFMSEGIHSDHVVNKAISNASTMTGDQKTAIRKETAERVKTLRNTSKALLRGVVPLGDCYTKGREMRVSVGVKPESIAAAGNVAGGMAAGGQGATKSPAAEPSSQGAPAAESPASRPLQGMDGYSNTKRLDNF